MYTSSELLFPPYAIPNLKDLRGPEWQKLVERVMKLPESHPHSLAFSLMMMRLDGCLTCETDNYKAMRGCILCAMQTVRRYKGSDRELLNLYENARKEVEAYLNERKKANKRAA